MKNSDRAVLCFYSKTGGGKMVFLLYVCALCLAFTRIDAASVPPEFTASFQNEALLYVNAHQVSYAPNLTFPLQITGPAEVTNATQIYVQFLSNSLGDTNLNNATAHTGFNLGGVGISVIPGIVHAPPNPNTNNLFYSAIGTLQNNQAWLMVNVTPGTNAAAVTNHLRLLAFDGNNNQTTNWALANLNLIVRPQQPLPPRLEVRFYNSSTNEAGQVYLLPTCKGLHGNGFWWVRNSVTNNWTNWMTTTTNMTVTLADIGISGTNQQGRPYHTIYTTNFPDAAWFVSYGGGHLTAPTNALGKWNGVTEGAGPHVAQPTSANPNGLWFGHEWNAFELTLAGNPADVGDTTYINQFSVPMTMRVFTNDYANAMTGVYTNKDSSLYYQIGGWTNFSRGLLSNVVAQMSTAFARAVITNASGLPVMVAGPSCAAAGTLAPPWAPLTNNSQNTWPAFGAYFETVKNAQPGRHAKIKDFLGLSGGPGKPTFHFYYDFDLTVTASNTLRLVGSMMVTNAPGSVSAFHTNAANLVMEIGADAGPNDNWASWSMYAAPTPANFIAIHDLFRLDDGQHLGLMSNLTAYSSSAANGLGGTAITIIGSNFLGTVQVLFCGPGNTWLPAPHFTVHSATNITVHVPHGAVSGPITLTSGHGSGKSAHSLHVNGTGAETGPVVTPSAEAPAISAFLPTSGVPATAVLSVSGDWMAIAAGTQTGPASGSPLPDLFKSSFGTAIMGRIAGDMAAGFAFGFINSDVINPAYGAAYGDSPSGSWWGGNQYPAANTNHLAYSQVNTEFSTWGNILYEATAITYGHPIYDRMQVYNGQHGKYALQPPVAPNHEPNIWMAEIEFLDGMGSAGATPTPASPQIGVLGRNGAVIQNGENASLAKGTDFGGVAVNAAATNMFSITTSGAAALTISGVSTGGAHAASFVASGLPAEVAAHGASEFQIVFMPAATGTFNAALAIVSDATNSPYIINLAGTGGNKAAATVTISQTNQVYDGTARPVVVETDPAGLHVITTYAGLDWAPTNAGTYAVTATVNEALWEGMAIGLLTISKAEQTITFMNPGNQVATNLVGLQVSADSGLAVTCSVASGAALISGYTNLTFTGDGEVLLRADQPGNVNWHPATHVMWTITVVKADHTIYFPSIGQKRPTDNVTLTATADSGLLVSFAVAGGPATITNGIYMSFTATGHVAVTASQPGNNLFNPATDVTREFDVLESLRKGGSVLLLLLE